MISIFFAIAFTFCSPVMAFSTLQVPEISGKYELESSEGSKLSLQVQNQDTMEQGYEGVEKPYEGFSVVAFGMIAIVLLIIVFVVYKVFQRMNKSRKGDQ